MKYQFHPEAEIEFNEYIDYYENIQENLGLEFAKEVYKAIQRVLNFPNAWQKLDNNLRRCLLNRFPFGIIYYQEKDKIVILAIMSLKRKPNYWKNRKISSSKRWKSYYF